MLGDSRNAYFETACIITGLRNVYGRAEVRSSNFKYVRSVTASTGKIQTLGAPEPCHSCLRISISVQLYSVHGFSPCVLPLSKSETLKRHYRMQIGFRSEGAITNSTRWQSHYIRDDRMRFYKARSHCAIISRVRSILDLPHALDVADEKEPR